MIKREHRNRSGKGKIPEHNHIHKSIAVIDIGSHSIRLYVGEVGRRGDVRQLDYLWLPIAIGKDAFNRGSFSNTTLQEAVKAVKSFKEAAEAYRVDSIRAYATSNLREASNMDVLIERIFQATGVKVEVVDPIEETESVVYGLRPVFKGLPFRRAGTVVLAIGGGSSQIVLFNQGRVVSSETHHIGTLKIIRDLDFSSPTLSYSLHPFAMGFKNALERCPDVKRIKGFIAVNDDALVLIQKVFPQYLSRGVFRIPRQEFIEFQKKIEAMDLPRLKETYQLNDNVLKTTKVAVLAFGLYVAMTEALVLYIPDLNSSYFRLVRSAFLQGEEDTDQEGKENIIASALAIGKKYQFDRDHALQVRKLSLQLFDSLESFCGLKPRERILLEVAAILHDIGAFVSSSSHNKHSAQLILSSEIIGLQKNEMKLIALMARYHRKSPPKPTHEDYNELPLQDRLVVCRLSALLRIADGLDSSHYQNVTEIRPVITEEGLEIRLRLKEQRVEYFEAIQYSVQKKSDLFESFFGVPVRLEMVL